MISCLRQHLAVGVLCGCVGEFVTPHAVEGEEMTDSFLRWRGSEFICWIGERTRARENREHHSLHMNKYFYWNNVENPILQEQDGCPKFWSFPKKSPWQQSNSCTVNCCVINKTSNIRRQPNIQILREILETNSRFKSILICLIQHEYARDFSQFVLFVYLFIWL